VEHFTRQEIPPEPQEDSVVGEIVATALGWLAIISVQVALYQLCGDYSSDPHCDDDWDSDQPPDPQQ
jgi:hypothetical protein